MGDKIQLEFNVANTLFCRVGNSEKFKTYLQYIHEKILSDPDKDGYYGYVNTPIYFSDVNWGAKVMICMAVSKNGVLPLTYQTDPWVIEMSNEGGSTETDFFMFKKIQHIGQPRESMMTILLDNISNIDYLRKVEESKLGINS